MELVLRKDCKCPMTLTGGRKSAGRFCFFSKVGAVEEDTSCDAPVYLNVYDLTPLNGCMYCTGLGLFHSGIEASTTDPHFTNMLPVHDMEYAFGGHERPSSGVFEVKPRRFPGLRLRRSIFMGTTALDPAQVRKFLEHQVANYHGDTYHIIVKNCNHFCKDLCHKLTGNPIPKWVNRLADIGYSCNCLFPQATKVPRNDNDSFSGEKRRPKQLFGCSAFISKLSVLSSSSSSVSPSPPRGQLSPAWELRKLSSVQSPLRER
ncbi:DeSI-like protein [Apostasia shenzhenica]|uniref:DeSI-like protein n=1 Tax=Apostasia shenzhenica TaxID=1088818 RepID=A0A2I0ADP1_9ASPA|nr:DeSI-like protein [Apostasia shenzhenica]